MNITFTRFALAVAVALAACTVPELDRAFGPDMKADGSNKVITKYCASCHLHKDFNAEEHLPKVQPRYDTEPLKSATECRACHMYSKDWLMMDVKRGTHRSGLRK